MDMNGVITEEIVNFVDKIRWLLFKYYDFPEEVFAYNTDCIVFNADNLNWLCEDSEEPEFWEQIRKRSKYCQDTIGPYYTFFFERLNEINW
jgi:hypothetical protein